MENNSKIIHSNLKQPLKMCMYNDKCSNKNCPYVHTKESLLNSIHEPLIIYKEPPKNSIFKEPPKNSIFKEPTKNCIYKDKCTNINCHFIHPHTYQESIKNNQFIETRNSYDFSKERFKVEKKTNESSDMIQNSHFFSNNHSIFSNEKSQPILEKLEYLKECKYKDNCTNKNCQFVHPQVQSYTPEILLEKDLYKLIFNNYDISLNKKEIILLNFLNLIKNKKNEITEINTNMKNDINNNYSFLNFDNSFKQLLTDNI